MRKSTKRELRILLILLLITIAFGLVVKNYTEANELKAGEQQQADRRNIVKDYDFKAKDINGNDIVLSEYKGKKILINFWSLSSSLSKKDMTDLETLYNETKDTDLVILSINVAGEEEKVRSLAAERGYSFPIILDYTGVITEQYHVIGFPTYFFVDKEGYLHDISVGPTKLKKIREYINELD